MLPRQQSTSIWLLTILIASIFIISCKKEIKTVQQEKTEEVLSDLINPFGDYWTELTNVPVLPGPPAADDKHISFSVNNKVYAVPYGYNQLWEYDPNSSQWTQKQSTFFPGNFSSYVDVFCNGNSVYLLNANSKDFREYNVATNVWTDRPDFPGLASGEVSATYTSTNGYIIGGTNGTIPDGNPNYTIYSLVKENWQYNFTTNTWTQKAIFPGTGRYLGAAHAAGDYVYFGTGISNRIILNPFSLQISYVPQINSDWWEYNTVQNTWTQKAAFGGGTRMDTRGFVIGGKVYMGLGAAGYYTDLRTDLWSFNASANTWTQRANYPPGNGYPPFNTMLAAGSRGYSITGKIADFWKYTPPIIILPPGAVQ